MSALWSGYWSVVWFLPAPSHSTYNYADLATEQGRHQTNARAVKIPKYFQIVLPIPLLKCAWTHWSRSSYTNINPNSVVQIMLFITKFGFLQINISYQKTFVTLRGLRPLINSKDSLFFSLLLYIKHFGENLSKTTWHFENSITKLCHDVTNCSHCANVSSPVFWNNWITFLIGFFR